MEDKKNIGIIEINNSVFQVVQKNNFLIAGTVCNVGMIEHYVEEIDNNFSFDENVISFIEKIEHLEIESIK